MDVSNGAFTYGFTLEPDGRVTIHGVSMGKTKLVAREGKYMVWSVAGNFYWKDRITGRGYAPAHLLLVEEYEHSYPGGKKGMRARQIAERETGASHWQVKAIFIARMKQLASAGT